MSRMKPEENLRGKRVAFTLTGNGWLRGMVITRLRGTLWQVASSDLPDRYRRQDGSRRITLDRDDFIIETAPVRKARSPIEAMIDRACGIR